MRAVEETALAREYWYDTPQGAFVFAREQALMRNMLSPWPRRGHNLLEVGCGGGRFLEMLWEAGFDVTGLDSTEALLDAARRRMGARAELQLGVPDLLPWDDNVFDYVVLAPLPDRGASLHDMLREAVRVAARGILLRFWNPCSLPGLCRLPSRSPLREITEDRLWRSWRVYRRLLRALSPGCLISVRSILYPPFCAWREGAALSRLNNLITPLPAGGITVLRMEYAAARPLIPLPLRLGKLCLKGTCPATAPMGWAGGTHAPLAGLPSGRGP